MKKRVVGVSVILALILFVSVSLVSANIFSDFWDKITGESVTGNVVWEIEDIQGFCYFKEAANIDESYDAYVARISAAQVLCSKYDSSSSCGVDTGCFWLDASEGYNISDLPESLTVHEGWNLIAGFYFPSQISYSEDITPEDVKQLYFLNPFSQSYVEVFPNRNSSGFIESDQINAMGDEGFLGIRDDPFLSHITAWVYFDKSGTFKFRNVIGGQEGSFIDIQSYDPLLDGWNFLGIMPGLFADFEGNTGNSFTLNNIKGTCNIEKAYFFGGDVENTNEWVEISVNDPVSREDIFKTLAVKVTSNCLLGKIDPQRVCVASSGIPNLYVKGTVTVYDAGGNVIESKNDTCDEKFYCVFGLNRVNYYEGRNIASFSTSQTPDSWGT